MLATRGARPVLVLVAIGAVLGAVVGLQTPRLLGHASNDFVASGSPSVRAEAAVERASGLSAAPQLLVVVSAPTRSRLARVSAAIRAERMFPRVGAPIYSADRASALVAGYARGGESQALWRSAAERIASELNVVPGVEVGGTALATVQVNDQVQRDLTRAEELAFPILFLLALFVFRSVVAALLPLLCGALTIVGSLLLLRAVNGITPVSTYALNIVTGAGLGLGIDYSLLLVSRYREELARSGPGAEAVRVDAADGRPDGRVQLGDRRRVDRDAHRLSARVPSLDGHRRRARRAAGGPDLADRPAHRSSSCSARASTRSRCNGGAGPPSGPRVASTAAGTGSRTALMRRPVPVAIAASVAPPRAAALPFLSIRFTGIDASVLPPNVSSRAVDTARPARLSRRARHTRLRGRSTASAAEARAYARRARALPEAAVVLPPRLVGAGVWEVQASSGAAFLDVASQRLVRAVARACRAARSSAARPRSSSTRSTSIGSHLPLAIGLLCVATFLLLYLATRSLVLPLKALLMNGLTSRRDVRDPRLRLPGRPPARGCSTTGARARSS